MTIRDWPTGAAFKAATFALSLDSSQSTARGFYTGNTQRLGHADRLRATLTLPPAIDPAAGGQREAFLLWWKSSGGQVRIPMAHRKYPNGSLRGSPVVATAAAAGARSVALSSCFNSNILSGGSFEFDANSDGLADGWTGFTNASATTPTYFRSGIQPIDGVWEQHVQAASLGTTAADEVGVFTSVDFAADPGAMTASVRVRNPLGAAVNASIAVECKTAGGASLLGSFESSGVAASSTPERIALNFTAPTGTRRVILYLFARQRSGADTARQVAFDAAALRLGTFDSSWPGPATLLAGDYIGVGGNLLCVDVDGATANDRGEMTVPLSVPLQKALSVSAAVTWAAPTGVWELDDAGLQLDYSAGNLQAGFAIPIRQVVA